MVHIPLPSPVQRPAWKLIRARGLAALVAVLAVALLAALPEPAPRAPGDRGFATPAAVADWRGNSAHLPAAP